VRLRDGDREVELHGPLPVCRQLLDELPQLWSRLRPQAGSPGAQGLPSIALPAAPRNVEPPPAPHAEPPAPRPERVTAVAARQEAAEPRRHNRHEKNATRQQRETSGSRRAGAVSRASAEPVSAAPSNGTATPLVNEVLAVLRRAERPIGIAEIRSRLGEDISGQAVRRILERTQGVTNVGGRPAAYRLR
jgi:hypothetical protein